MSKTKINKTVFQACQKQIGMELEKHGYKPHPAYQPGWEPSHQEYDCKWLKNDLSVGIDEVSMGWKPEKRLLRISRSVVRPTIIDASTSFQDLPTDPFAFSSFWLDYPFIRFTLLPRPRRFWQFRKMDLRFLPQDIVSPEAVGKVVDKFILTCLPVLLAAKEGESQHRYLVTDHFGVTRTAKERV